MIRGRVISFDRIKGYGFVVPDTGGDDVFIHVNDLQGDKDLLVAGSTVEFRLEDGDRGPKAAAVTVISSAPRAESAHRVAVPEHSAARPVSADGEPLADVLSVEEYAHEVTEALLRVEPELTSRQILDIRKRLTRIGQEHSWLDR